VDLKGASNAEGAELLAAKGRGEVVLFLTRAVKPSTLSPVEIGRLRESETPNRWTRRRILWLAGAVLAIVGSCPFGFYAFQQLVCLPLWIPTEPAPGKWHLPHDHVEEWIATCRALMRDPKARGSYWSAHATPTVGLQPDEHARSLDELPRAIVDLAPVCVSVTETGVSLGWDDDGRYGYGYYLLVLPERADVSGLRSTDRHFCRNIELREGVWSQYFYH